MIIEHILTVTGEASAEGILCFFLRSNEFFDIRSERINISATKPKMIIKHISTEAQDRKARDWQVMEH